MYSKAKQRRCLRERFSHSWDVGEKGTGHFQQLLFLHCLQGGQTVGGLSCFCRVLLDGD